MRYVDRAVAMCGLEEGNVVKFLAKADRMRPAYCIALRPERKQAEPCPYSPYQFLPHCCPRVPNCASLPSQDGL